MSKHTHSFQAEVAQLLHLVTHSLYSNKEIFLRELVSNASDACDKLRYEALNNTGLYEDAPTLEIKVAFDKAAKTLTISDNGIGMSQQDAIDHLGTIAKSGTRDFMSKLSGDQQSDAKDQGALIGQFGVGFYSGFIVADKIVVETRRAGLDAEQVVRWTGGGSRGVRATRLSGRSVRTWKLPSWTASPQRSAPGTRSRRPSPRKVLPCAVHGATGWAVAVSLMPMRWSLRWWPCGTAASRTATFITWW